MDVKEKHKKRYRRHKKVRGKVSGTAKRPRLCVSRSTKHIYAQLINDEKGKTLATASDLKIKATSDKRPKYQKPSASVRGKQATKKKKAEKGEEKKVLSRKLALAFEVGKLIAQKANDLKIEKVVFDRGGYKYHGRVKALAEGAREGGLKF